MRGSKEGFEICTWVRGARNVVLDDFQDSVVFSPDSVGRLLSQLAIRRKMWKKVLMRPMMVMTVVTPSKTIVNWGLWTFVVQNG